MSLAAMFIAAAIAARPLPTPPVYVTPNYALTFQPPKNTTYCPLPKGWVGSDHGTVLFLVPPKRCGGEAGYPSSGRGFSPDVPRIEVYYGYWDPDDDVFLPCPDPIGATTLAGETHPLCRSRQDGALVISVWAHYRTDSPTIVQLTLTTTPERFDADLAVLRSLAATVRPCQANYWIERKRHTLGSGKACPRGKWF